MSRSAKYLVFLVSGLLLLIVPALIAPRDAEFSRAAGPIATPLPPPTATPTLSAAPAPVPSPGSKPPATAQPATSLSVSAPDPTSIPGIIWLREFGGRQGSVVIDAAGNAYLGGSNDYYGSFLIKYDPSGNAIWDSQFRSQALATAIDNLGNVYLAGYTYTALSGANAGGSDVFVRKYNTSGTDIWTKQLGSDKNESAWGVAVDSSGNSYVAGFTDGALPGKASAGMKDAFIIKYDSNGNMAWSKQFGSDKDDRAIGVAADSAGNSYVVGHTDGAMAAQTPMGNRDAFIFKFDSSGNVVWARQFGSDRFDRAFGVALDPAGNPYVVGYTDGDLYEQKLIGGYDAYIVKFDSAGNRLWVRQFGTELFDHALAVAIDRRGNAYVVGDTDGAFPGHVAAGETDIFIVGYDPTGNRFWTRQFGTSRWDNAQGVGVDPSGNVFVVGNTNGAFPGHTSLGSLHVFVAKVVPPPLPPLIPPSPTATPTPPPTPTPSTTWVELTAASVKTGPEFNVDVQVWIRNLNKPWGLGSYDLKVTFDPTKIKINSARGGPYPFGYISHSYLTGSRGSNTTGILLFNSFAVLRPGPTGDIHLATINVSALVSGVYSLVPSVTTLGDADGGNLTALTMVGVVTAVESVPPQPTPTPTPTLPPSPSGPTPAATPTPNSAWVQLTPVSLNTGPSATADVEVWVRNLKDPYGLGSYDLRVTFDRAKIRINSIRGGSHPFEQVMSSSLPTANITGKLLFNSYINPIPGPTGDIRLATINLSALSAGVHSLVPSITTLSSSLGYDIAAVAVNGLVTARDRLKVGKSVRTVPDNDNVVVLSINLGDITNPVTGEKVRDRGVKEFQGEIGFGPGGMDLLAARPSATGPNVAVMASVGGVASFRARGTVTGQYVSGAPVARLVPRLTGPKDAPVEVTVTLPSLTADDGVTEMEDTGPTTLTFRRGAVRGAETSNIIDALFIAQYLAGLRDISQINALNAASIYHEGPNGDRITIIDALALAQQLAGIRDNNFEFVK